MKSYIITVKDFQESPKGDSMWYHVVGEDGKKHTLKDEFLKDKHSNILSIKPLVQPGYTCELIKEQHGTYDFKGKEYPNMEVIEVKASTTQQAVKEAVEKDKSSDFATFHLRQSSIERQNALTNAVNSRMRDTVTGVLELAETFYNWTSKGIIPQIDPNALSSPSQEPTEVSKETAPVKETSKSLFAFGTAEEFKESMQFLCAELKLTKAQATTFLKDNFGVDGLSGITSSKDRCKAIDMLVARR